MIFYNPADRDFLDANNQIRKEIWKNYWRLRALDPETRREVRCEKAATKKRIHQKDRRHTRDKLRQMTVNYKSSVFDF
jgi:hypothetical protein